ncbi:MAG: Abi family protein [Treponema sp.]|nr:Abi family protein [Treponema sp.]
MATIKPPTTYKQQIEKLRLRGCIIADESQAIEILSKVNYYRLTAYFLPFKQPDETYRAGTDFNTVYQIYEFDRKIRNLMFLAIEEIEINLRSSLAYYHAQKYGALGYLDNKNYYPKHDHTKFLSRIDDEKKKRIKEPFVQHHLKKYGGIFPIWVIIELFTFTTLSHFYADLPIDDQKYIARKFYKTHNKTLRSWLRCSTDLRNFCAHFGRLYYRIFTSIPDGIPELDKSNERSLFAVIMVLRNLFTDPDKWNNEIYKKICSLINEYSKIINFYHIGFPQDWEKKLMKYIV